MTAYFKKHFPTYGVPNVKWFYLISVLQSAWFQIGNWILYALLYVSTGSFAMFEAAAFAAGILVEIPSGAFADLFGRRRTVIIGAALQAIGSFIFTFGFLNDSLFFIGNLLIIVSFSFRSGAQEALVYDSMQDAGQQEHFDDVIGKARSLVSLCIVIVSVMGGLAWTFSIYAPWALTTVVFVLGFFATLQYKEPVRPAKEVSVASFIAQNKKGFHYLLHSNIKYVAPSFGIILASFLMWHTGIIRSIMGRDFGYDGQTINYLIAFCSIVGFATAFWFKAIRKKLGDKWGYTTLLATAALGWGLSSIFSNNIGIGLFVFICITASGVLAEVWTSVLVNKHIHSKDRATALSTLSFLVQIPYVFVVVVFGSLIESGRPAVLYAVVTVLLVLATLLYVRAYNKTTKQN